MKQIAIEREGMAIKKWTQMLKIPNSKRKEKEGVYGAASEFSYLRVL
jgi:hypothetical protein